MPFQTKLSVSSRSPANAACKILRTIIRKFFQLPADPRQKFAEDIFNVHVQLDFHPGLGTIGDFGQHKIAPAFHDTQHFRPGLAPVIGMLHALQTDRAIERAVCDLSRVGPLPRRELAAATALFRDVAVAGLVGDIEYLDVALGADARSDVLDKTARLDALADDQNLVAGFQFEPIVDEIASGLRLAPHKWQAAEQYRTAPAFLLILVEYHLTEAAHVIGLHPGPGILVIHPGLLRNLDGRV